ncbi:hypothetical protein VKT23_015641 [Stygiomarasmius scandens]|uniref:EF-hand domain-containing protein n=1 Tax=Marasmiellus scandens TaxID=2682957 RepID=A0ABR1IX11_9AGAR
MRSVSLEGLARFDFNHEVKPRWVSAFWHPPTTGSSHAGTLPEDELVTIHTVKQLKLELSENIDHTLKTNMILFSKKLDVQKRDIKELQKSIARQGDRVITAIKEGPHDHIVDPDLYAIWKEMGWKLSVPASEFVFTLHDFYVAQFHESEVVDHFLALTSVADQGRETMDAIGQREALKKVMDTVRKRTAEKWTLKYINIANLQGILEAFDGDASGYVSVWEVNAALAERPPAFCNG